MAITIEQLRAARARLKTEAAERATAKHPPIRMHRLAPDVLEALRLMKEEGASEVRVGEIGKLLREAGLQAADVVLYPPIKIVLEDHFQMKLIGVSNGLRYEMPCSLPVIGPGWKGHLVVQKVADYDWPKPGEGAIRKESENDGR